MICPPEQPQGVRSVQMLKNISAVTDSLGRLGSATVGGGSKPVVSFADPVTGCSQSADVVVPIVRKKGKAVLRTMATTGGSGRLAKDPDTIVVTCIP